MEMATKGNLTGETTHQVLITVITDYIYVITDTTELELRLCESMSSMSCGSVSCGRLEIFIVKHQQEVLINTNVNECQCFC